MNKIVPIVGTLRTPFNLGLFIGVSAIFFALNYYALANLPSSNGFMCTLGGNLTPMNILFSLTISMMAGLVVSGLAEQIHQKKAKQSVQIGSTSTAGLALGTLTSFCTLCSLSVISLFGIGGFLAFVSENQFLFRVLSLAILGISAYLLNRQLKNSCGFFCRLKS